MTSLEKSALQALDHCRMSPGTSKKRFYRDMSYASENPEFKMTVPQARYLWLLVDYHRKQIQDHELLGIAQHVKVYGEFPDIYLPEDHRILEA